MLIKIACPNCGGETTFSLSQESYEGPFRCWKCHNLFRISLANGAVASCETMSSEEANRLTEELKRKHPSGYY